MRVRKTEANMGYQNRGGREGERERERKREREREI